MPANGGIARSPSMTNTNLIGTFKRIPGEAELTDDVSRNIRLDPLAHLGLTFCSLQTLVELLRIKLLRKNNNNKNKTRCCCSFRLTQLPVEDLFILKQT